MCCCCCFRSPNAHPKTDEQTCVICTLVNPFQICSLSGISRCLYLWYISVIKLKVILIERLENRGTIIHGRVGRIFKQNNVTIQKGRVKIWSNSNSTCPSLGTGKVFVIGGYESASGRKLLLSSTSLIEAWSDKTLKKIRRWHRLERKGAKKEGRR